MYPAWTFPAFGPAMLKGNTSSCMYYGQVVGVFLGGFLGFFLRQIDTGNKYQFIIISAVVGYCYLCLTPLSTLFFFYMVVISFTEIPRKHYRRPSWYNWRTLLHNVVLNTPCYGQVIENTTLSVIYIGSLSLMYIVFVSFY